MTQERVSPITSIVTFNTDARVVKRERSRIYRKLDPIGTRSAGVPDRAKPATVGRNDPCPCGSGAKAKKCARCRAKLTCDTCGGRWDGASYTRCPFCSRPPCLGDGRRA